MSTPANFNGQRPAIDANDAVMLLIDHQSGLFQTVGDMPMPELRARAAARWLKSLPYAICRSLLPHPYHRDQMVR